MSDPFATVPKKVWLPQLYNSEGLNFQAVLDFLGLKKTELASILDLKPDSVRFDARMSEKVRNLVLQIANLLEMVAEFFEGDAVKTRTWFQLKNPMLGGIQPIRMIKMGRAHKLQEFLLDAKSGNFP